MSKPVLSLKVSNVDYNALLSDAIVLASFVTNVKGAIAHKAGMGITADRVALELSENQGDYHVAFGVGVIAGSVNVKATITPPSSVMVPALLMNLNVTSSLVDEVVSRVAAVDGIEGVSTGTVTVSHEGIHIEGQAAPALTVATSNTTTLDLDSGIASGANMAPAPTATSNTTTWDLDSGIASGADMAIMSGGVSAVLLMLAGLAV